MLIGELSEKTGLSRDTIRFYEKEGLIKMPKKLRRENNYKEYPESTVDRIVLIKSIQEFGFTLKEIDIFFELWQEEDASCKNLVFTLENKLAQVEATLLKFNLLKERLTSSLQKCRNNECEFENTVPGCLKC
jgi:DNA-binding transcriptional MerR regulator